MVSPETKQIVLGSGQGSKIEGGIMEFYYCEHCGALYVKANQVGNVTPVCCGEPTKKLTANTTDAAVEKHVPVVTREGNKISVVVGEAVHPMEENHFITMIAAVQGDKVQSVALKPGEEPKAEFFVEDGPVTVYEHCNKHGLWKAEA